MDGGNNGYGSCWSFQTVTAPPQSVLLHQQSSIYPSSHATTLICQLVHVPVPSPSAALSLPGMKWNPDTSTLLPGERFSSHSSPQAAWWMDRQVQCNEELAFDRALTYDHWFFYVHPFNASTLMWTLDSIGRQTAESVWSLGDRAFCSKAPFGQD